MTFLEIEMHQVNFRFCFRGFNALVEAINQQATGCLYVQRLKNMQVIFTDVLRR